MPSSTRTTIWTAPGTIQTFTTLEAEEVGEEKAGGKVGGKIHAADQGKSHARVSGFQL